MVSVCECGNQHDAYRVSRLYEHPEGASEWKRDTDGSLAVCDIQNCEEFVEVSSSLS